MMDTSPPPSPAGATVGAGIRGAARRAARLVLVASLALLALGLTALTLLPHLGGRGLIVTSGSMSPAIDAGALVIARRVDPARIAAGDIITYAGYDASGLTTHRVVGVVPVEGRLHFQTQGDANDTPDPDLAPAEGLVGRVELAVPHAGRALAVLFEPWLRLVVLGVPAAAFTLRSAVHVALLLRHAQVSRARRNGAIVMITAITIGAVALTTSLSATGAVLVDEVLVSDNTFATGSWTATQP